MKYEMIFGDEYLADKFTNERSVFIVDRGGVYFEFEDGGAGVNYIANFCAIGDRYYMRRIIAEPKRWTVEDQKAGRLPDVGCKVATVNGSKCEVIAIDDSVTEDVELALRFSDGSILVCKINKIKPIETPEEKAARLCNECCKTAADIFVRHPSRSGTESMEGIYKAMLSGDLPVPVKE